MKAKVIDIFEFATPPTLMCRLSENGKQISFWCPFCECVHRHGAVKGHRIAHCHVGPMAELGYILDWKENND